RRLAAALFWTAHAEMRKPIPSVRQPSRRDPGGDHADRLLWQHYVVSQKRSYRAQRATPLGNRANRASPTILTIVIFSPGRAPRAILAVYNRHRFFSLNPARCLTASAGFNFPFRSTPYVF